MLSQNRPTPQWDFPPCDLKMSKSPILDFRFNNNQEIVKMVSTIARTSSAAKNKPPKKKIIDPTFPYKTGLKTALLPFFTFLFSARKSEQPPIFAISAAWGLGGVHHTSELSLGKWKKNGGPVVFYLSVPPSTILFL